MSSYPTYEEWKLCFFNLEKRIIYYSSYPTYEEWKRAQDLNPTPNTLCSYPTYEEWKQIHFLFRTRYLPSIL